MTAKDDSPHLHHLENLPDDAPPGVPTLPGTDSGSVCEGKGAAGPESPPPTRPAASFSFNDNTPLRCAADDCNAGADDGSVRIITGERWFRCRNGHLNAELVCVTSEAA